jgi:quinoprotein glucose dehydrogenase
MKWADQTGRRRLFLATIDARLICLGALTGKPCLDFGSGGEIDLRQGIKNIIREGEYEETSPPAIIDNLVIVGSSIADHDRVESPSGIVRAFDVHTGALQWNWNPIPQRADGPASKTWQANGAAKTGAANAWSVIVTDPCTAPPWAVLTAVDLQRGRFGGKPRSAQQRAGFQSIRRRIMDSPDLAVRL